MLSYLAVLLSVGAGSVQLRSVVENCGASTVLVTVARHSSSQPLALDGLRRLLWTPPLETIWHGLLSRTEDKDLATPQHRRVTTLRILQLHYVQFVDVLQGYIQAKNRDNLVSPWRSHWIPFIRVFLQ
jgi:hypothetical protein